MTMTFTYTVSSFEARLVNQVHTNGLVMLRDETIKSFLPPLATGSSQPTLYTVSFVMPVTLIGRVEGLGAADLEIEGESDAEGVTLGLTLIEGVALGAGATTNPNSDPVALFEVSTSSA
jgi:hypothetical protein